MSKYTAEQVLEYVEKAERGYFNPVHMEMLRDYAALLRERESAKERVTDEIVATFVEKVAAILSGAPFPSARSYAKAREISDLMIETVAPMLASESSEELKYWEQFGREIEKRLRYNQWSFKGSYPEIIDQIIKLASAQVPEGMVLVQSDNLQKIAADVETSMDSSTTNSYRAAIYQQELYERQRLAKSMLAAAPKPEGK